MTFRTATRTFPLLLPLLLASHLAADTGAAPPVAEHSLWLTATDAKGAELGASLDLEIADGAVPARVTSTAAGPAPRVVLYFDLDLLTEGAARGAAIALSELARELVGLGPVELVLAQAAGSRAVPLAGTDAEAVNAALAGLALRQSGRDRLGALREEFSAALAADRRTAAQDVAEAVAEETRVLRGARERLALFAADGPSRPGGVLVLVTGGGDEDPRPFYSSALAKAGAGALAGAGADALLRPVVLPSADELGRILAAHGWTLIVLDPGRGGGAGLLGGPVEVNPSVRDQMPRAVPSNEPGSNQASSPRMVGIKLGRDEKTEATPQLDLGLGDSTAWRTVAAGTGGELFSGGEPLGLRTVLARLRSRTRVTFTSAPLAPGEVRALAVSAPAGTTLQAPHWLGRAPLESVAAVRVRQVLAGEEIEGELPLEATVELVGARQGRLFVRLQGEVPTPFPPRARWTLGVAGEDDDEPLVFGQPSTPGPEPGLVQFEVNLPAGVASRVAILGEDLDGDRFGVTLATLVETGGALELSEAPSGPRIVRLAALDQPFVFGPTPFTALISSPEVRRVEFLLDGEPVGVRSSAPWVQSIDLGEVPRRRDLEVIARAADGRELGRDWLRLNEGSGAFRVRIVEPRAALSGATRTGPVDVSAEVVVPEGSAVARVEFHWNATLVATRLQAPWRQRVTIPPDEPGGFLRVVAHLVDGSSAEDVLFPNAVGTGERIDVELVEIYVAVSDRDGRAVAGLGRSDFRVYEEGTAQQIASFAETEDLPVTVGLAIDSSASMFVKLPIVGRAAGRFVEGFLRPRDRGFVVGFGGAPSLAHATTPDGDALVESISRLRSDGQTAIWEGLVYALVQLQGATGQKALIVYTDGADEDDTFSYDTALRFARRVGVPVYVILANNEIVRTEGRALGVRRFVSRVRRLAESVGGRVYLAHYDDDLAEIYAEIGRDLRSQYLVAFYPQGAERGWRRLRVTVPSGFEARAASGYFR